MRAAWAFSLLTLPSLAASYSFQLTSAPTQCGNVNLEITQGSGSPPYTALVVPFGSSPTKDEQRRVFQHIFNDKTTSFQMNWPANGGFVIALSDQNGVGTGGTSVPQTVMSSNDASCLIDPNSNKTTFSFQIIPNNAINQCEQRILAWTNTTQGKVHISVIIPGGQSTAISTDNPTPQVGTTLGVQWTPNIRTGTNIILVAGDDNGPGSGGSINTAVGNNANQDSSCIDANAPSSTPGTAAGAVETGGNSGNDNSGGQSGGGSNVGGIVGGIIGGIVGAILLLLLVWFFMRRRRARRHQDVDLLPEGEGGTGNEFYQPEPFVIPSSARTTTSGTIPRTTTTDGPMSSNSRPSMSDMGRRYSAVSTEDQYSESNNTSATPMFAPSGQFLHPIPGSGASGSRSNASRKSPGGPPMLRPVNVVQHEDGGELPVGMEGEGETIELPPAYTAVGRSKGDVGSSEAATAGGSGSA